MLADSALTDNSKLRLPADLISELQRRGPVPKTDLRIEGWKPSFFGRLLALLTGKRAR